MSGVTILEQQHVFVTLLDFRDGALLHGVIPNLNICTNLELGCICLVLLYDLQFRSSVTRLWLNRQCQISNLFDSRALPSIPASHRQL